VDLRADDALRGYMHTGIGVNLRFVIDGDKLVVYSRCSCRRAVSGIATHRETRHGVQAAIAWTRKTRTHLTMGMKCDGRRNTKD